MNRNIPKPENPLVDWTNVSKNNRRQAMVEVTCPVCLKKRMCGAYDVARRIREGKFTGHCADDHVIGTIRSDNKTGRLPHPSVDWSKTQVFQTGKQRINKVEITCPICGEIRWGHIQWVASAIAKNTFTGKCVKCGSCAKKRDWLILSPGRRIEPSKGYVRIARHAVPEEYQWLWDSLKRSGSMVLEHRLVMSKELNRPLLNNELVDHMDGNKLNNDPSNLRLYIRGKNMPGETTGYGTYYHEWQFALSTIRKLEEQIRKLQNNQP